MSKKENNQLEQEVNISAEILELDDESLDDVAGGGLIDFGCGTNSSQCQCGVKEK